MFKLFLILFLVNLAFSDDLVCYDCDPNKAGKCEEPDKHNVKQTLCKDLLENDQQSVGVKVFSRAYFIKTKLISNQIKSANDEEKFIYDCISIKYVPNPGSDTQKFPEGIYRGCVIRQEREDSDPCLVSTNEIQQQGNGIVTACSSCNHSLCNRDVPKGGAASFSISGIAMLSAIVCFYLTDF